MLNQVEPNEIETSFKHLISSVGQLPEVLSIGRTGGNRPLPASPDDGDIDVFLYCSQIPEESQRREMVISVGGEVELWQVGVFSGGRWGTGDLVSVCGVETWLMYYTVEHAKAEAESILSGVEPDRENSYFYPIARLGMLLNLEILLDRTGFLRGLQARLAQYPEELAVKLEQYHLGKLDDTEDLERAALRKDVLFYHFALDLALDHFLQALFARNRAYFPSRKRSLQYIREFTSKPVNCEERLTEIVRLGGSADGIERSFELLLELVSELKQIVVEGFQSHQAIRS